MRTQIRDLVADALYQTSAYQLPSVCERFGLEPGESSEAFSGKIRCVMNRLNPLSHEKVIEIAKDVVQEYPHDPLQAALERIESDRQDISEITRRNLAEALDSFTLAGKRDELELLSKHWPDIEQAARGSQFGDSLGLPTLPIVDTELLPDGTKSNSELLNRAGLLTCSRTKFFRFLEDVVDPSRRTREEQEQIVESLNPILERDGYALVPAKEVSGYPTYQVRESAAKKEQPAEKSISEILSSFDESGVHNAWKKSLERRELDPEGAITAARTLLETVCKHIIESAGEAYGKNDDLVKLYATMAECIKLAPSQHTEQIFKSILGNCQSVVGNLAAIRNRLGDAHGQGKLQVKPQARHAELAVNLAGSMAMFLVSTWNARNTQPSSKSMESSPC